jgi:hypothetical protein
MGDENKKPDTPPEPQSGFPQKKIVYAIIAIAFVILAVVLIAKFSFNVDLLNPASGEMSIVKRQPVAEQVMVQKTVMKPDITRVLTLQVTVVPCSAAQTRCGTACIDTQNDPSNCGSCGRVCSAMNLHKVSSYGCSAGKCTIKTCDAGYGDCQNKGTTEVNSDGCETDLQTGQNWVYNAYDRYVGFPGGDKTYLLNPRDCGTCGNSCGTGAGNVLHICDTGACKNVCSGPWLNCNNNWADKCEEQFDSNNCRASGVKCPAGSVCNGGCCEEWVKNSQSYTRIYVTDSLGGISRWM